MVKEELKAPSAEGETKNDKDMSEEDKRLKEELGMLMERLKEDDSKLYKPTLENMKTLIRSSTTSMTSVPKPLKFMRLHYEDLKTESKKVESLSDVAELWYEVISVLAMGVCDQEENKLDTLLYRFKCPNAESIGVWGHEYVRHLAYQLVTYCNKYDLNMTGMEKAKITGVPTGIDIATFIYPDESLNEAVFGEEGDIKEIRQQKMRQTEDCFLFIKYIVTYFMDHNAESEAVDLCSETTHTSFLIDHCNTSNYQRTCLYMLSCLPYLSNEEVSKDYLSTCMQIYSKFHDRGNALRCTLRNGDVSFLTNKFLLKDGIVNGEVSPGEKEAIQKQMAFIIARHSMGPTLIQHLQEAGEDCCEKYEDILYNEHLSLFYLSLARELDIMDPKIPEDVYKTHLEPSRPTLGAPIDCARSNHASSFVNGFLNCGYCGDKLLTIEESAVATATNGSNSNSNNLATGQKWVYKNKDVGMMDTVGTFGWLYLWDIDRCLHTIDRYFYAKEDWIKAGAYLAAGISNCGIRNESEPSLALLRDPIEKLQSESGDVSHTNFIQAKAAIIGLGLAYAGNPNSAVIDLLSTISLDSRNTRNRIELASYASLALGIVSVGTAQSDARSTLLQTMLERPADQWSNPIVKLMALGLALTCLSCPEAVGIVTASLLAVSEPMRSMATLLVECCGLAGSGNVLKIQQLLHILSEKYAPPEEETNAAKNVDDKRKKRDKKSPNKDKQEKPLVSTAAVEEEDTMEVLSQLQPTPMEVDEMQESNDLGFIPDYLPHQSLAVICIALIAMGDDISQDMSFRMFGHLLRFGEPMIKRAVPLALALSYISNPQLKVLDLLSKFSHDTDNELAYNAILSLGIVGAGTNHARLAAMLRQLAIFHQRDSSGLFMVRVAQGLTHLGKGTLGLSPWHSDKFLLNGAALGGILGLLVSCTEVKKTFFSKSTHNLFFLTTAIQPRFLMTVDKDLKQVNVTVRVGQAVDVVGQAGKPKTITGFQTHTTPVLLGAGERAELATEEYRPMFLTPLEGLVLLEKNPDYVEQ